MINQLKDIPGWAAMRRLPRDAGFVASAREQYEEAEKRRASYRRLRKFRYGSIALDLAKADVALLPDRGTFSLAPIGYDPNGFETQCAWALQIGLMALLGPPVPEQMSIERDDEFDMERA